MKYFLILFRADLESIEGLKVFLDSDEASRAYSEMEDRYRDDGRYEVVLVGADSEETIRQTHSRYFTRKERTSPF